MATLKMFIFLVIVILPIRLAKPSPELVIKLIHSEPVRDQHTPKVHDEATISRLDHRYKFPTFLANVSVGRPPMPQQLHLDTGSSFTWMQCLPCSECFHQSLPIFDPSGSTTFRYEPCEKPVHDSMPNLEPVRDTGNCKYRLRYLDGANSQGYLVRETLIFETADSELAPEPDLVFGCGHHNKGIPLGTGNMGLGAGSFSLVKQLGSKFSFCFGSLRDLNYRHSILVLGEGAKLEGDTTELEIMDGKYYVKLDSISVDGTLLPIDPWVLAQNRSGTGGTVLDTGCSVSSLVREAYESLKQDIDKRLEGALPRLEGMDPYLCYNGSVERDMKGFPYVTFTFEGGAQISVSPLNLFYQQKPNSFCLAVDMTPLNDVNIIGVTAMQNYNFGFDLDANKVFIQSIDCELLLS